MDKLKPCPFCGDHEMVLPDTDGHFTWIICVKCGSRGAMFMNGRTSLEKAADAWNRRADRVVHMCPPARWEKVEIIDDDADTGVSMVGQCSRCGKHGDTAFWFARDYWSFCPYCGAMMINGGLQWEP